MSARLTAFVFFRNPKKDIQGKTFFLKMYHCSKIILVLVSISRSILDLPSPLNILWIGDYFPCFARGFVSIPILPLMVYATISYSCAARTFLDLIRWSTDSTGEAHYSRKTLDTACSLLQVSEGTAPKNCTYNRVFQSKEHLSKCLHCMWSLVWKTKSPKKVLKTLKRGPKGSKEFLGPYEGLLR